MIKKMKTFYIYFVLMYFQY